MSTTCSNCRLLHKALAILHLCEWHYRAFKPNNNNKASEDESSPSGIMDNERSRLSEPAMRFDESFAASMCGVESVAVHGKLRRSDDSRNASTPVIASCYYNHQHNIIMSAFSLLQCSTPCATGTLQWIVLQFSSNTTVEVSAHLFSY